MARMNQAMTDLLRYNAALLPTVRSGFDKSHSHTTTIDSGYLVPIMWDRVVPGDEKQIRVSALARMATPIHPVMDQANLDIWCFYVPDRLWWNKAKEFYGENLDASFNPDGEYQMPSVLPIWYGTKPDNLGSLNDYFGMPIIDSSCPWKEDDRFRIDVGLWRCYQKIWNDNYRNTSVQPALRLNDGSDVSGDEWNIISQIRKVCKYPDFFTSLLREPQAGNDVFLPLGEWAPVVTRSEGVPTDSFVDDGLGYASLTWNSVYGEPSPNTLDGVLGIKNRQTTIGSDLTEAGLGQNFNLAPGNLWANLTNASAVTINNLRSAVTIQQLLERDAVAGKFYQRILQAHFGVFTPDATLQRPEILGQCRVDVGMRQVLQTSASAEGETPQGNTAAVSVTNMSNEWICNKAFTEPGYIMVLCAVRPVHSYSQGIDPLLMKLNRYDHYWPVFDRLGNQPVMKSSIFACWHDPNQEGIATGSYHAVANEMDDVLGYSEPWVEYKVKQNRVSGLMRPDANGTLGSWNYSSDIRFMPTLNSDFVTEDPAIVDRTIAVQDEPQFLLDVYFDYKDYKNMSVNSVPGLLSL